MVKQAVISHIVPKTGQRTLIDQFGPKTSKMNRDSSMVGPFYQFRIKIGRLRSVFLVLGPKWLITVRFTSSGSKSVNYSPFYLIWVKIGRLGSVLLVLGPKWSIIACFVGFRWSKLFKIYVYRSFIRSFMASSTKRHTPLYLTRTETNDRQITQFCENHNKFAVLYHLFYI